MKPIFKSPQFAQSQVAIDDSRNAFNIFERKLGEDELPSQESKSPVLLRQYQTKEVEQPLLKKDVDKDKKNSCTIM